MKVIASLSSAIILSFTCTAQSFAITPSFQSLADQSLSNPSQPTLVAGFFDPFINITDRVLRIRRQQQDQFDRQQIREDAELAREQRLELARQQQLQRQAEAKARQEKERIYFASLTPKQQKQYIAKKKAQQNAAAMLMTTLLIQGMTSGGGSVEPSDNSSYDRARTQQQRTEDDLRRRQPEPQPAPIDPVGGRCGIYGNGPCY
jgi:hypothetical protein